MEIYSDGMETPTPDTTNNESPLPLRYQLFVDALLEGKSQTEAFDYTTNGPIFSIGNGFDGGGQFNPFSGLIDEVAVFDHALSQAEVTALFAESMVPEPSTMLLLGLGGLGGLVVRRRRN